VDRLEFVLLGSKPLMEQLQLFLDLELDMWEEHVYGIPFAAWPYG
jgi:hypothetical protein